MGRHKKGCSCERCKKREEVKIQNEINNSNNIKTEEIPKEIPIDDVINVDEKMNTSEDKVFFEINNEIPAESKEQKNDNNIGDETIKILISGSVVPIMNIVFMRMEVPTLCKEEETAIIESTSLVIKKYSSLYEFRYKEEISMLGVYTAVILPRVLEYKERKNKEVENTEKKDEN